MPITSTKNFRLSSGFGVSNSMWPRWARSKIGSGVIRKSLSLEHRSVGKAQACPSFRGSWRARRKSAFAHLTTLTQRPRYVVEHFIDRECTRDQPLLRAIFTDQLQRAARFFGAETGRARRPSRVAGLQHAENLAHGVRLGFRQGFADHHHVVDRHHI